MNAWDIIAYAAGFFLIGIGLALLINLFAAAYFVFVCSREELHRRNVELLDRAIELANMTGEVPGENADQHDEGQGEGGVNP